MAVKKKKKKTKNWMQTLNLKKNALRKTLGTPKGKKIPLSKLKAAKKSPNPKTRKRATLALTFRKSNRKRG
jgi:oligoendopeptidase F